MANIINSNNEAPAAFKAYLSTLKGFVSASDAKDFAKVEAEIERLRNERNQFSSDKATEYIRGINQAASDDPSVENIEALKKLSPDEVRSRYANITDGIVAAQVAVLERAKPLFRRIRDSVIPIVEKEMARVEADNRAAFERYGAKYDRARDVLVMSIERFRNIVAAWLPDDAHPLSTFSPNQVTEWLGAVRGKAGLLG